MHSLFWLVLVVAAVFAGLLLFTRSVKAKVEAALPPLGRFIDVPGARLHVVERGQGPPLLLIHGLAGNLCNFTYGVVDRLATRYQVIAVDRPGSGYSVRLPGTSAALEVQADAMAALIDRLQLDRPVVVGHSLGGALSLCLAQRHPGKVRALALVAPLTHPPSTMSSAFNGLKISAPWLQSFIAWTLAVPISMRTRDKVLAEVFGPEPVPADFGTKGGGFLGVRPSHFIAACQDLNAVPAAMDALVAAYARMDVPVQVLFGRGDLLLDPTEQGAALVKALPGATLTLVDGGHMLPLTQVADTAGFIASVAEAAFGTSATPATPAPSEPSALAAPDLQPH